jgi:hypothetical protein
MGFHFQLAITGGHAPEKRFRAVLMFGDFFVLDAGEFFEERTVFQNHALHVRDKDGNWNLRAEEELEKHFIAGDLRLRWCAEPLHQLSAAFSRHGRRKPGHTRVGESPSLDHANKIEIKRNRRRAQVRTVDGAIKPRPSAKLRLVLCTNRAPNVSARAIFTPKSAPDSAQI